MEKPLAIWWFVHPDSAMAADQWVRGNIAGRKDDGIAKFRAKHGHMTKLTAALPAGHVVEIQQFAGDEVFVPPGWIHMVSNQQACVKLAFDYYEAASFPAYVASWMEVGSKVTRGANVQDYMVVNLVLPHALCER